MAPMAERSHKSAAPRILCCSCVADVRNIWVRARSRSNPKPPKNHNLDQRRLERRRDGMTLETGTLAHADRALRAGHSSEHGHHPAAGGMFGNRDAYHRAGWVSDLRPRLS